MIRLKLRFIEFKGEGFRVQRKTFFGWRNICYSMSNVGGTVYVPYFSKTRDKVLNRVLKGYYKTCKECVIITEYPSLLVY